MENRVGRRRRPYIFVHMKPPVSPDKKPLAQQIKCFSYIYEEDYLVILLMLNILPKFNHAMHACLNIHNKCLMNYYAKAKWTTTTNRRQWRQPAILHSFIFGKVIVATNSHAQMKRPRTPACHIFLLRLFGIYFANTHHFRFSLLHFRIRSTWAHEDTRANTHTHIQQEQQHQRNISFLI